ncbi:MAG: rhomboid family intramembrane serine protease [Nanoarchaeota archaeon]
MDSKNFSYSAIWLLAIMTVSFAAQSFIPGFTEIFVLNSSKVFSEPWRLVTAIFLHGSIVHLLMNSFALFLFGLILEKEIGTKKFLMLFFASGITASFGAALFYPSSLGASGAIYGILGMLGVLRPGMTVWVSYVPMPMAIAIVVWAVIDLFGFLVPSNIANAAHLSGLFLGVVIGLLYRKIYPKPKTTKRTPLSNHEEEELDDYERSSGLR